MTKSCQGTRYDVKNLAPNTEYTFRVRVENVFGVSKPSQTTFPIRTRTDDRWLRSKSSPPQNKSKLVRRHSHHIKVESSVSSLLSKADEEETGSIVGTIPFKRNSSIRTSLPLQRRPVTSVLPGARRESVCSKESRRSIEESSVFTDDTDDISSLKLHRISTSTEDDSCDKCSSSAASMTSIVEESELSDVKTNKNEVNKNQWRTQEMSESEDILSAPYSDDTKLAWVSRTPPSDLQTFSKLREHSSAIENSSTLKNRRHINNKQLLLDNSNEDEHIPVWKNRHDGFLGNKSTQDLRSLRHVLNSNDLLVKTLASDNNGNYAYHSKEILYENTITEVDEESVAMDIVSSV